MMDARLRTLSRNLWWSWDPEATRFFASLDPSLWSQSRHNPVLFLQRLGSVDLSDSQEAELDVIYRRFVNYTDSIGWSPENNPQLHGKQIAYFSMEFGLHESLRIYSGGLGVLAGDHLRSASDLDVPLVAVGLFYHHGYFRQVIDDFRQAEAYPLNSPADLPLHLCRDAAGDPIVVSAPLGQERMLAQVWRLDVGRRRLYLLDTRLPDNSAEVQGLCDTLYGGDEHTRIRQEVLLGMAGVQALREVGENADVYHLNEGHCAFIALQLLQEALEEGLSIEQATDAIRERCVFTTHTPVPAGHDRFSTAVVKPVLGWWANQLGFTLEQLMDLGRVNAGDAEETLCMTVLALRFSAATNGVSALHGEVSRQMWADFWPGHKVEAVPIGHITNGVHPLYWVAPRSQDVFDEHCSGWRERPWDPDVWRPIQDADSAEIWAWRNQNRQELVQLVRDRSGIELDPDALTIGFARRFAPYKRGDLIFTDPTRLRSLLEGERPVQLIFAGKAHPRDTLGKELVETVVKWSTDPRFRDRVLLLEDYDMHIGRALTSGCDVWLNNPRRPREASGTSGQKVIYNGGLNLSVLDGWWPEGFDGTNGWEIGGHRDWSDTEAQDAHDADHLLTVLEQQVVREWSERDAQGVPTGWVQRIRRSIATCAPKFSSHRMVRDYVLDLYIPRVV